MDEDLDIRLEDINDDQRSKTVQRFSRTAGEQRRLNVAQKALKENSNLDLENYKPYLYDFCKFSQGVLPVENLFDGKRHQLEAQKELRAQVVRKLSRRDDISALKRLQIRKRLPPDGKDDIPEQEVDTFAEFGTIGWKFVQEQLFRENATWAEYITQQSKISQLKMIIRANPNEVNRQQALMRFNYKVRQDKNFHSRVVNDFETLQSEFTQQFKQKYKIHEIENARNGAVKAVKIVSNDYQQQSPEREDQKQQPISPSTKQSDYQVVRAAQLEDQSALRKSPQNIQAFSEQSNYMFSQPRLPEGAPMSDSYLPNKGIRMATPQNVGSSTKCRRMRINRMIQTTLNDLHNSRQSQSRYPRRDRRTPKNFAEQSSQMHTLNDITADTANLLQGQMETQQSITSTNGQSRSITPSYAYGYGQLSSRLDSLHETSRMLYTPIKSTRKRQNQSVTSQMSPSRKRIEQYIKMSKQSPRFGSTQRNPLKVTIKNHGTTMVPPSSLPANYVYKPAQVSRSKTPILKYFKQY